MSTSTRTVIILDQFTGPSPYRLQQLEQNGTPMRFSELRRRVEGGEFQWLYGVKPRVVEVPETYQPDICETVYAENAEGNAYAWKMNWDSSG